MRTESELPAIAHISGKRWSRCSGVLSGVHSRKDAARMMAAGADALLVGTELIARPGRLGEINRF